LSLLDDGIVFGGKDGELEFLLHGEFGLFPEVSLSGRVVVDGVDDEQLPFFLLHGEQLEQGVDESVETEMLEDPLPINLPPISILPPEIPLIIPLIRFPIWPIIDPFNELEPPIEPLPLIEPDPLTEPLSLIPVLIVPLALPLRLPPTLAPTLAPTLVSTLESTSASLLILPLRLPLTLASTLALPLRLTPTLASPLRLPLTLTPVLIPVLIPTLFSILTPPFIPTLPPTLLPILAFPLAFPLIIPPTRLAITWPAISDPKQGIGRALDPEFEFKDKEANTTKRVVKRILII
jgi:hypothetical protein